MNIVVGTDFSPASERALLVAARLARRLGDTLDVVHVVEAPPVLLPEVGAQASSLLEGLHEAAQDRLDELLARLDLGNVALTARIVAGVAEDELPALASGADTRLLALGRHGRKAAARFFVGSVVERIVRKSDRPVLVVPQPVAEPAATHDGGRRLGDDGPAAGSGALRVVVAIDASRSSDAALGWTGDFARGTPCDLTLVHVYWPLREHTRFGLDEIADPHEARAEVAELLRRELEPRSKEILGDLPVRFRLHASLGEDADPLAHEAHERQADLLVVGRHARERRDRRGSTAIATIRAAHTPVLCVPAAESAALRPPPRTLRKLLVPVDMSAAGRAQVELALSMVRATGGVIELLHVVRPSRAGLGDEARMELERRLSGMVPPRDDHGIIIRAHFAESDAPAQAIAHAADRLGADAIVLGGHVTARLKHPLGGSVGAEVLRTSHKPVMVVPAQ